MVKPIRMIKDLPRNSILVLGKDSWDNNINSQVEQLRGVYKERRTRCLSGAGSG